MPVFIFSSLLCLQAKLQALNELLWPLILEDATTQARQMYKEGHEVVVLEAAVLQRAGWATSCHEVWVSIVPPEEVKNSPLIVCNPLDLE